MQLFRSIIFLILESYKYNTTDIENKNSITLLRCSALLAEVKYIIVNNFLARAMLSIYIKDEARWLIELTQALRSTLLFWFTLYLYYHAQKPTYIYISNRHWGSDNPF